MLLTSSTAILCFLIWMLSPSRLDRAVSVLDHLGKMGQREIVRSYSACIRLLFSAGGAGFITVGTVILKTRILHAPLNLLSAGLFSTINFAGSFLLMQAFGFRLATKQAPLLGAALARRLKQLRSSLACSALLRNEMRWSFRTQFLSAFGNLAFVIPAAMGFHWIYAAMTGHVFLDPLLARKSLQSLNPLNSGTLVYAAFTGCLLWLCTLTGGALANRFKAFSKGTATAFFNISLGAVLAFAPLVCKGLGIPLDVRHFTLSGGMVALATASLGFRQAWNGGLLAAMGGVVSIGILNFSVSFALAFLSSWANGGGGRTGRAAWLRLSGLPWDSLTPGLRSIPVPARH